jgi:ENTH domain
MYASNVIALGKAALVGSETEQRITVLLYDDNYQVISSFELNQIASLTYHEGSMVGAIDINEKIIDSLLTIVSKPADYSPLTIEKALTVTKHVLIFGCSKVIHSIRVTLGRFVEELQTYNTALLAQQQTGATGIFMRLKGGSVDKGGPVRDLAVVVTQYMQNDSVLQFERNTQADPNSLVPIGDRTKVSFVSDDARLRYLKRKIEHQQMMDQRSNLAKATDGFGAGYMSRDGKNVVGAAHGIDEMIRQAQRTKNQFTDDGTNNKQQHDEINVDELRQYAQEFEQQYGYTGTHQQNQQRQHKQEQETEAPDLLSLNEMPSSVPQSYHSYQQQPPDLLLDFGPPQSTTSSSNAPNTGSLLDADFYGSIPSSIRADATTHAIGTIPIASSYHIEANDPFMPSSTAATMTQQQPVSTKKSIMGGSGLSSFGGVSDDDPFSVLGASGPQTTSSTSHSNKMMSMSGGMTSSFAGLGLSGSTSGSNNGISTHSFAGLETLGPIESNSTNSLNLNTSKLGSIYSDTGALSSMTLVQPPSSALSDPFTGIGGGLNGLSNSNISTLPSKYANTVASPIARTTPLNLSSIQVSHTGFLPSHVAVGDDDLASGFVMGGTAGSGLMPLGAAPGAAPPPPPPSEW